MSEWLSSVRLRVRALLRRRQLETDFDDELAFHLATREEQLRSAGRHDPRRDARHRFGSPVRTREDLREAWTLAPRLTRLFQDYRYAARTLRASPGFTTVVVLTLALGIGANTAFFSVVNAVLIRPLGYADAGRLVSLQEGFPQARIDRVPFSALDFGDLQREQQSFESVGAYRNVPFELSGDGTPERITGARVTADLFPTLGVAARIGRTFTAEDDRPGTNVAILSRGVWQRRFAADPAVLGRRIQLDRQPYTIVGVMPAGFSFPKRGPQFNATPADVWVPMAFTPRERLERGSQHANSVVARLKAGTSLDAARAELDLLARRIASEYPAAVRNAGFTPQLFAEPLRQSISGRFESPLFLLLAAVGLVLLVACANVANLVLSRAACRTREFAVRTALGAGRAQLVRLLFCEASLLSLAGGLAGIAIGYTAIRAVPAALTSVLPGVQELAIDLRVLAFTATLCVVTTCAFALAPLVTLDRRDPEHSLRDDTSRATSGLRRLRVQRGFVVVTVGLACMLLVGAGLFIRSFSRLIASDAGFRPARVLTASMTLPRTFYTTASSVRTFHDTLSRSLEALPGVRAVALATDLPLANYDVRAFTPEGVALPDGTSPTATLTWVHGPYFETLGMRLTRGRFFETDEHRQARAVVVVNEKLAALVWPGQDPVGKRLKWGGAASAAPWLTVVGVVANVADGPIGVEPRVHAYEPFRQLPDFFLNGAANQFGRDVQAAILADSDPRALAPLVRSEIARLDPDLAVESIATMDDRVSEVVTPQRVGTLLVSTFAAMALLLASVGLYGLLAFGVRQRRREIAVRIALGAARHVVVRLVLAQGGRLVAIGLAAGLMASLGFSRIAASLLYRTDPYDHVTFVAVPAVLAAAAFIACIVPAWRAARVEPMTALRTE